MKFSVGYQLREQDDFLESIICCKECINEIYFSWGDFANGRNSQIKQSGMLPWEAQRKQEEDLKRLSGAGLRFNLLFNATCYGKDSQSRAFFEKIGETVDYIQHTVGLQGVTTTSLLIARFIHNNFSGIDVRASVNMSIGSAEAMDYVKDLFDSFYLKRELNRDIKRILELKEWCNENGKEIYGLANSGCLNDCPAHVFHDNLVSHESEIAVMDNGYSFESICRRFLKSEENLGQLLDRMNFIRPEDVCHYEGVFPALKLATRVSPVPIRILKAYAEDHSYKGNVLDLLEPNHSGALYPKLVENEKIQSRLMNGRLKYEGLEEALVTLNPEGDTLC